MNRPRLYPIIIMNHNLKCWYYRKHKENFSTNEHTCWRVLLLAYSFQIHKYSIYRICTEKPQWHHTWGYYRETKCLQWGVQELMSLSVLRCIYSPGVSLSSLLVKQYKRVKSYSGLFVLVCFLLFSLFSLCVCRVSCCSSFLMLISVLKLCSCLLLYHRSSTPPSDESLLFVSSRRPHNQVKEPGTSGGPWVRPCCCCQEEDQDPEYNFTASNRWGFTEYSVLFLFFLELSFLPSFHVSFLFHTFFPSLILSFLTFSFLYDMMIFSFKDLDI